LHVDTGLAEPELGATGDGEVMPATNCEKPNGHSAVIATACLEACASCKSCHRWAWDKGTKMCTMLTNGPKYVHRPNSVAGPKECNVDEDSPYLESSPWLNGCDSPYIKGPDLKCAVNGFPVPPVETEKDCMAACCGDKSCKVYQFKSSAPKHAKCWIATTIQECNGEQGWASGKKPASGAAITKGVCDTLGAVGAMEKEQGEDGIRKALDKYPVAEGMSSEAAMGLMGVANSKLWKMKCMLLQSGIECNKV
jgi:hypothetical protein